MGCTLNCLKNIFYCPRNDTLMLSLPTLHCMCFSCPCLSICEYCPIVSFEYWLNNWESSVIKYWFLFAIRSKNWIKCKISYSWKIWLFWIRIFDCNSSLRFEDLYNKVMLNFFFIWWSTSNNNFNSLCFGRSFEFRRHICDRILKKLF